MKYKIVKHYNKENGHFTGYELKGRWLFFLPWKHMNYYQKESALEHDIVWLSKLDHRVVEGAEYN